MTVAAAKATRVRAALCDLVAQMQPGDALPTERALAETLGVARMTVRTAIASLVREGRLRAEQGRGTFVQPEPIALRVRLGSFAAEIGRAHLRPSTTTLACARDVNPPDVVRRHLRLRSGRPAVRIERLRLGDGTPLALERAWFPHKFGQTAARLRAADQPLLLAGGTGPAARRRRGVGRRRLSQRGRGRPARHLDGDPCHPAGSAGDRDRRYRSSTPRRSFRRVATSSGSPSRPGRTAGCRPPTADRSDGQARCAGW